MTIREAVPGDLPEMVSIGMHILNDGELAHLGIQNTPEALAAYASRFIKREHACALVYEQEGAIVGFILAIAAPSQFGGELIAKKCSWCMKAKGYGAALLRAAETWAASRGAKKWLVSLPDPMPRPVMERLGFRPLETLYEKVL